MEDAANYLVKLLLVGDSGVGKSSILLRFVEDSFDADHAATIGVDFKVKLVRVPPDKTVKLFVWDTAGQERFRTLTSSYYRGAQGVALVFDCSERQSFDALPQWLGEVNKNCGSNNVIKMVIANKIDTPVRCVSRTEGEKFAMDHALLYTETSARTAEGVAMAFDELVCKVLDDPRLSEAASTTCKSEWARHAAFYHACMSGCPLFLKVCSTLALYQRPFAPDVSCFQRQTGMTATTGRQAFAVPASGQSRCELCMRT